MTIILKKKANNPNLISLIDQLKKCCEFIDNKFSEAYDMDERAIAYSAVLEGYNNEDKPGSTINDYKEELKKKGIIPKENSGFITLWSILKGKYNFSNYFKANPLIVRMMIGPTMFYLSQLTLIGQSVGAQWLSAKFILGAIIFYKIQFQMYSFNFKLFGYDVTSDLEAIDEIVAIYNNSTNNTAYIITYYKSGLDFAKNIYKNAGLDTPPEDPLNTLQIIGAKIGMGLGLVTLGVIFAVLLPFVGPNEGTLMFGILANLGAELFDQPKLNTSSPTFLTIVNG